MYIDTSCLVAFYIAEPKSSSVQKTLKEAPVLQLSQLADIELLSALNKKIRLKEIDKKMAEKVYSFFQKQRKQGIFVY